MMPSKQRKHALLDSLNRCHVDVQPQGRHPGNGEEASMGGMAVWGAGAIGGTVGAWMARAGLDVVLVDREAAHAREIQT